jgi:hypothetical protein
MIYALPKADGVLAKLANQEILATAFLNHLRQFPKAHRPTP